jgi:hypothetical protein
MASYTLMMNLDEAEETWSFVPNDLWDAILRRFLLPLVDGIAFEGVADHRAASRLAVFDDVHGQPATACDVRIEFLNELGTQVVAEHPLLRFTFTPQLQQRLAEIDFDEWSATSAQYPADSLFFFDHDRLIANATPVDALISFYDAAVDEVEALTAIDDRIARNLHVLPDRTVSVMCR